MMMTAMHATRGQARLAQTARGSLLRTYLLITRAWSNAKALMQKRQVVATLRQAVAKCGLPAKAPGVLGSGLPLDSLLWEIYSPVVVPVVASVAVREVDCGK